MGSFLRQLLMAVASPLVAPSTPETPIVVHTQSLSKNAPPGVCILPEILHRHVRTTSTKTENSQSFKTNNSNTVHFLKMGKWGRGIVSYQLLHAVLWKPMKGKEKCVSLMHIVYFENIFPRNCHLLCNVFTFSI